MTYRETKIHLASLKLLLAPTLSQILHLATKL